MHNFAMRFVAELDEKREMLGVSRKKWLKKSGVAESTFYRWIAGETHPNTNTIVRLEKALKKTK
jgi:predicted transcriptional regulator